MIKPGALDLVAQRWQPFKAVIDFPGYDFTDATIASEVRAFRDSPGGPIITLTPALVVDTSAPLSTITLTAPEATINGLNFTNPPGGDLLLVWDIHITTAALGKLRWIEGAFTVRAGSTQNG